MSQEKAQLIAPQGHFTVPGLNVAGVVTASSFSGDCTGTASSIAQGTNVVVGVMTASSFAGDVFGNAAGLSTTTAGLKLGIVTATSFAGNFTGIGSGLTGTPNIVAGLVTASQFVGNTPGLAAGISAGKNLAAGIVTATTFYGDGSNLTGAGSTAYIRQTVGSGTTIDLNNGNIILFEHVGDTTVSFANTSTADDVTIIRSLNLTDISISTGGVDFDRVGDYLSFAGVSIGTNDFTIEAWIYPDGSLNYPCIVDTRTAQGGSSGFFWGLNNGNRLYVYTGGADRVGGTVTAGEWSHVALVRDYSATTTTMYINGLSVGSWTGDNSNYSNDLTKIGFSNISGGAEDFHWAGKISNVRVVVGRALYTTDFYPPSAELTNVADTKLLCCQSDSSTTAAAVIPSGSITANGNPTAGAETLTLSPSLGSAITWPTGVIWNGGSAPTLLGASSYSFSGQVFNLVTADGGSTWYGYEEVNNNSWTQSGELYTWGANTHGVLGQNNTTNNYTQGGGQLPGTTWTALAGSFYTAMGTKSDGTLWTWGRNSKGSQGLNTPENSNLSSPTQIPGTTWKYPADNYGAGGSHNAAIKTDGTLWAWGNNSMGALGQNATTTVSSPVQIPGTTWQSVTTNYSYYMFGTKTDGTLWAWGGNYAGVLGLNQSSAKYSSPVQIPGTTWGSAIEGKIAVGQNYSTLAIKTDGTMWAWGENQIGALGLNQADGVKISSPTQVPGTTWKSVAFNSGSGVNATKTDGTLWGWGDGSAGGTALNSQAYYSSPVQVPGTDWDRVWMSNPGSMKATRTDGTLWGWGWSGINGTGPGPGARSSPVQVPGTWGRQGMTGGIKL